MMLRQKLFSSLRKKAFHELRSFICQYSPNHNCLWMKLTSHFLKTSVFVTGAKNNSRNLTPIQSADTHLARFKCHVKRTVFKVFSAQEIGGGGNGLHLGMGSDIV